MNDLAAVAFFAVVIHLILNTKPWYARVWWYLTAQVLTALLISWGAGHLIHLLAMALS